MKKAGSSNSKSKTRRTSKSTDTTDSLPDFSIAVGHRPPPSLSVQDETLFRAFQSNLLSLISHELRTPLMGVLNALVVLEESGEGSSHEWVRMARQNAQKLQRGLSSLLDLAALESGTFHARLREVDLIRLIQSRVPSYQSMLNDYQLKGDWQFKSGSFETPLLADPQKLGRAIDLCLEFLVPRTATGSTLSVVTSHDQIEFVFELNSAAQTTWENVWSQSLIGAKGGVTSPYSAFGGVLQSEQAFLTRIEEGLGSELLLIHEIARLHQGKLSSTRSENQVRLKLEIPALSSEDGLRAVLTSRAYSVSHELSSVGLILIEVPSNHSSDQIGIEAKNNHLKASDAVYYLSSRKQLALVLDDCKMEDLTPLMDRLCQSLNLKLHFGLAHCPSDGHDPAILFELAEKRLSQSKASMKSTNSK